jgi:hypothetical protein
MKLYREHFLGADLIVAVILSSIAVVWMADFGGIKSVDSILAGNRSVIYGTLSTIFGSLLGFVITAVSIIVGVWGAEKLALVRGSKHAGDLWLIFSSTTRWLGFATVLSLAGLIADRDSAPLHAILYIAIVVGAIALARLARSIWALDNVVRILAMPETKS